MEHETQERERGMHGDIEEEKVEEAIEGNEFYSMDSKGDSQEETREDVEPLADNHNSGEGTFDSSSEARLDESDRNNTDAVLPRASLKPPPPTLPETQNSENERTSQTGVPSPPLATNENQTMNNAMARRRRMDEKQRQLDTVASNQHHHDITEAGSQTVRHEESNLDVSIVRNEQDYNHAVVAHLLERLHAVDRTDAQEALETIDALLLEEEEKLAQSPPTYQTSLRRSLKSTGSTGSCEYGRAHAQTTRASLNSVQNVATLPVSEKSLLTVEDGMDNAGPAASRPSISQTDWTSDLEEPDDSFVVAELPIQDDQPGSCLVHDPHDSSNAMDQDGNPRPGAYSYHRRAFGQLPAWGRRQSLRRTTSSTRRRGSFLLQNSASRRRSSAFQVQAVLVEEDKVASEEQMRNEVTEQVRREVVSEILADSVDAVAVEPDDSKARATRFKLGVALLVLLSLAVIGLSVGLTQRQNDSPGPSPNDVIATVPETICYDRFPGQGHSLGVLCNRSQTFPQGGGVCNVVCKAFLDQTESADFCITNAGACRADIQAGDFLRKDAGIMLPFENNLTILTMTGEQVVHALADGIRFALNPLFGTTGAYPYGNAIRYNVDALTPNITNVEVNRRMEQGEWEPIEMDRMYKVVTHTFLAGGGDNYFTLKNLSMDMRNDTGVDWEQALVGYALETEVILDLALTEYSTQGYTPPSFSAPP